MEPSGLVPSAAAGVWPQCAPTGEDEFTGCRGFSWGLETNPQCIKTMGLWI